MENFTPTDAIALQGNRGYNDGIWGGEWFWIIIILFFAWGGNGFGRNNGFETDIDTKLLQMAEKLEEQIEAKFSNIKPKVVSSAELLDFDIEG